MYTVCTTHTHNTIVIAITNSDTYAGVILNEYYSYIVSKT